jgi:transposase-like protein
MPKIKDKEKYSGNPHVSKITDSNIQFTVEFKIEAINEYQKGIAPEVIFKNAGIDLSDFADRYAIKSITRWIQASEKYGVKNLDQERRGKNSAGRPGSRKFKSVEEELEYLRAENEFLKELHALEASFVQRKNTK